MRPELILALWAFASLALHAEGESWERRMPAKRRAEDIPTGIFKAKGDIPLSLAPGSESDAWAGHSGHESPAESLSSSSPLSLSSSLSPGARTSSRSLLQALGVVEWYNEQLSVRGQFWSRIIVGGVAGGALLTTYIFALIGEEVPLRCAVKVCVCGRVCLFVCLDGWMDGWMDREI